MPILGTNTETTFSPDGSPPPILIFSRARGGNPQNSLLIFDAAPQETIHLSNTITDDPVEKGPDVSDHIRPNPLTYQVQAIISNTPLSSTQQLRTIQSGSVSFKSTAAPGPNGQQSLPIGAVDGYAQNAWKTLRSLSDSGVLLTIVSSLDTFFNMAIEDVSIPRTSKNYDALECTISFKYIRLVQNQFTQTTVAKDRRVGKSKKAGSQTPAVTPDTTSKLGTMVQAGQAASNAGASPLGAVGAAAGAFF